MFAFESRFCDRVLRDNTAIIFDFNVQLVVWQNAFAELQNPGKSVGPEPVFRVAPDVCLEQDLFFVAGFATAVDEVSCHVTNFGYVRMSWDIIAVGQDKSGKRRRMLAEEVF